MLSKEQIMVECVEKSCRLHWRKLCTMVPFVADTTLPKIVIKDLGINKAGTGSKTKVTFNINFIMTVSYEQFDVTVIHELCHTYAARINSSYKVHGDLWKFLFNTVMGIKCERWHDYCPIAAQNYKSKKVQKNSLLKKREILITKIKQLEIDVEMPIGFPLETTLNCQR